MSAEPLARITTVPEDSIAQGHATDEGDATPEPTRDLTLGHGRTLRIESGDEADVITLRNPNGDIEVEVVITPEGPRLRLRAIDLSLVATRRVTIDCEDFELRCKRDMEVEVGGDQREVIAGVAHHEAHATTVETRRGDLTLRANDDARVEGERVLLNS